MKRFTALLLSAIVLFSCEKTDDSAGAPEIPPIESMLIDLGTITNISKSATTNNTNWFYSSRSVGAWNAIIATTFAVPVASFKAAFSQRPEKVDELTWQWSYSVTGFTNQYSARLLGKIESDHVKWEMYISKDGIDSFDEFMWFEGTSNLEKNGGQWILYHSAEFPEETIQIDWQKESDKVGEIRYTYIRELNNNREQDPFKDSYLIYGLRDEAFDIYVNMHAFSNELNSFADTFIEWNSTDLTGRVMAEHFYSNTNWHCWDINGNDIDCGE